MNREEWNKLDSQLVSRRIAITKSEINGRSLGRSETKKQLWCKYNQSKPAGVDLIADTRLKLQMGDRVTVVGSEDAIASV